MLNASSVTRRFGTVAAVSALDLSVDPGELFCLLGANGAGKTTTINLFLGFVSLEGLRLDRAQLLFSISDGF